MFYTIYKITNLINDKIYIGKHQTKNLDDNYMGSGKHLKRSIEKYGIENFKKEILFQFDNEQDMNEKEAELVTEEFCSSEYTYNICVGGQGGFSYINKHILIDNKRLDVNRRNIKLASTPAARSKANAKLKLHQSNFSWNNFTPEQKQKANIKRAKTHTGMLRNDDTRNKMSDAQKGSNNSQYGTMWITNGQENKKIKKDVDIIPEGWYKGRK